MVTKHKYLIALDMPIRAIFVNLPRIRSCTRFSCRRCVSGSFPAAAGRSVLAVRMRCKISLSSEPKMHSEPKFLLPRNFIWALRSDLASVVTVIDKSSCTPTHLKGQ
jgi:hypothetical protein